MLRNLSNLLTGIYNLALGSLLGTWSTGEARGEVMRKCLENSGRVRAIMVDLFPPGFFTSVDAGAAKP